MQGKTYLVGVDLGYMNDHTAIAVLEKTLIWNEKTNSKTNRYNVTLLEKYALGTPYLSIVRRVAGLMASPALLPDPELVMDTSGLGQPVYQMMRDAGLCPRGITITSGATSKQDEDGNYNVPRNELLGNVLMKLETDCLKIADMELTPDIQRELEALRLRVKTRRDVIDSNEHDDLVMAVALPLWYASQYDHYVDDLLDDGGNQTLSDWNPLQGY